MDLSLENLPLGEIPRRNDPLGEFHCIRPDPRYAGLTEPTNHWTYTGSNWRLAVEDDVRVLHQPHERLFNNTIIVFDQPAKKFAAYSAEVFCPAPVRDAVASPAAGQEVGLVFHFHTALDYLALVIDRQGLKLVRRRDEQFEVLADSLSEARAGRPRHGDLAGRWLRLAVARVKGKLVCSLDGQEALSLPWPGKLEGRIGLLANSPAKFRNLAADARPLRPTPFPRGQYPRMKLVRKIDTRGFGAHRQLRFGDLAGEGRIDILVCQRVPSERGLTLGCITAISATGEMLWQTQHPRITDQPCQSGDVPVQINDIDGDGRNEVVTVRDFEFVVLDAASGQVKFTAPTPDFPPLEDMLIPEKAAMGYWGAKPHPYPKLLANCLRFADLAGRGAARDVLVKDHHHHIFALSPELKLLWRYTGNIGHYPYAADINGDGRDEVVAGYQTLSADGRKLEFVSLGDHADAVYVGDAQGWGEPKVIRAGGDDGLIISSFKGEVTTIRHGHVQRLSIGNFRPDAPGLEYALCTFWGAPGIVALVDGTNKLLWSRGYPVCGNTLQPVNWTGTGQELMLFSAHPRHGGLYDWRGRQVVRFPDDGHPELCSEALDLHGTGRDNLLAWNEDAIWIYEPDGELPSQGRRYAPRRPPLHSWSNFMAYWSLPEWR